MKKLKRMLSNILFLLKPWWQHGKPLVLIYVLSIAVYPFCMIAQVTITQAIIEAAQSGLGIAHIFAVAAGYISVILAFWIGREARVALYGNWKFTQVTGAIERYIYEQAIRTDYTYIDSPQYFDKYKMATEEFVTRSRNMFDIAWNFLDGILAFITMGGVIAINEPRALIFVLAGLSIMMIFRVKSASISTKIWKENTTNRRRTGYLSRLLYMKSANSDMRATAVNEKILARYETGIRGIISTHVKYRWRQFGNGAMRLLGAYMAEYSVMIYSAIGFVNGSITSIGVLTTLVAATGQLSYYFSRFADIGADMMETLMYTEEIRNFFELRSYIEPSTGGAAPPDGEFSIELRNVSFTYPNSEFSLCDISLSIKPNEKIAIVGENGAGKTTLSKLLLRLYDTDSGDTFYNGRSICEYDVHRLRRRIGVAFQEPHLYALTVRENLQVYHSADDDTLREILQMVRLDVELDSEVTREFDENGEVLSGGQIQKLGLARLLTGGFGLILLDEPSSALDPLAEYEMMTLMFEQSQTTTIMVAHRLSTVRNADRIYLVSNGTIAEQGTHAELIALGGKYAEMFAKQAENYVN